VRVGEVVGDAYGRLMAMRGMERSEGARRKRRRKRRSREVAWKIETQNVRGFTEESQSRWLSAWRRTPVKDRPAAWLLQETHVSSEEEAENLRLMWSGLWGRQHQQSGLVLSYWSVHTKKEGGVAILLNPNAAITVQPWNNRVIAVQIGTERIVNVYAPNSVETREEVFTKLQDWPWGKQTTTLAGDFNSVQSPPLDRMGGTRSGKPESQALQDLLLQLELEDAVTLEADMDESVAEVDSTQYFTYWGPDSASRIDRFYVPQQWTKEVHWVEVLEPAAASDHQCVRLHLHRMSNNGKRHRAPRGGTYPIRTAQPDRVVNEIIEDLADIGVGFRVTAKTWDQTAAECTTCIRRKAKEDTTRRKKAVHRLNAQNRAHLLTRRELLRVSEADSREEHLVRIGQRLERTTRQLRWQFKRVSNWESDQTITGLDCINGEPFQREMSIADKFKSEWKPILGKVHSAVPGDKLESEFDSFVQVPASRRVTQKQNTELMETITTAEVIKAISDLNRHKAAGPDGLNNDFFKDIEALLVPAMVAIGNELLQGAEPPKSFLGSLIIPLRKKGDSTNAMDCRPISLLQTAYKVFTKVMATRMQRVLGKTIGSSQQGFIHERQMQKTVVMMLAALATAKEEPALDAERSRIILLLDFRKAYDTVAREFLFLALSKFGFSHSFVELLRKLHAGTTARFLVNGELSDPQEVISGIRQGCPLAPLLFILAAEILAIAIHQNQQLQGIEVPGGRQPAELHVFSAFVDDSTLFLQEARQLPIAMEIVERFGLLSGLQVQPAKSHLIFLNTAIMELEYKDIPVLQHGDTVRYLGYQVGTGEMINVNWANRIRNIQRRLATATQLATSVATRVLLLNVVMLPSILFTAAMFDMPQWAATQLRNLQKQYLWRQSVAVDTSRHKMNPGLIFTPMQAGGLGVVSIELAVKVQRIKDTMQWLIQRNDLYWAAWKS
jgi:exonuclease III